MSHRTSSSESYRYGFNGMEQDPQWSGNDNSYTTEFRQYDPRLGRWRSLDPMMQRFPEWSAYTAYNDNPIYYIDPYGLSAGTNEECNMCSADDKPDDADEKLKFDNTTVENWDEFFKTFIPLNYPDLREMYDVYVKGKEIYGSLQKYKGYGAALENLMSIKTTDKPSESLKKMESFYSSVSGLLPYNLNSAMFAAQLSTVLPFIRGQIDIIQQGLKARDEQLATYGFDVVAHPGAWPGGWDVYKYIVKLKEGAVIEIQQMHASDEVVAWVKDNYAMLNWAIDQPPVKRKSLFGFDNLWPDEDDERWLMLLYFHNNLSKIETLLYGNLKAE